MGMQKQNFRYRLGIDVGVASIGTAILALENCNNANTEQPNSNIFGGSVRVYPIPVGAEERREKRGIRRNIERRERRLDRLSDLLTAHGIGTPRKNVPKHILDLSPIKLRAQASREKIELAHFSRALLHMARHRGSSAIRESTIKEDDREARQVAGGIKALRKEMADKGFSTYGQYLRWREKQNLPIRINQEKMADGKDGYAYYPSRELMREEFDLIWSKQTEYHPKKLTDALKRKVARELFFQRAITSPPPGKCPYFPSEDRLPKTSRLFQLRRIYEESNHLRFSDKNGKIISYGKAERERILARLMAGEDLTFAEIKITLDLKRTDKVNMEDTRTRKGIAGYPFDRDMGSSDGLGDAWLHADEAKQDEILEILATVHDDDKAIEALSKILDGDREAALRALRVSLPSGWGHMGLTATRKILAELKKDVIPARKAEDLAGLFHGSTADGVIHDVLPYYGEILVGHTVPPMWVSDYRRDTDNPPQTDPMEKEYGRIPNPVVHLALNQIRLSVNAVIKRHGLPESIHIELARDLNKSAEARDELAKQNKKNQDASDEAARELAKIGVKADRLGIQKYRLWKEQGGVCVYTGNCLGLADLYGGDVDVDHILPRSITFSDSMANKAVCRRSANADKNNRSPYDAFADNKNYDWAAIMRRVEKLPSNKQWRFQADALKRFEEDPEQFRVRYGVDNSYIARVARQYLACLYGEPHHVVAVSSYIVALLRGKWGLQNIFGSKESGKKARDDHRHHFIDALVTAYATRGIIKKIQTEASRCEKENLETFVETILPPFGGAKDFYNAVKEATLERVTLSRKTDHSKGGQLHQDTLFGVVSGPDKDGSYVCRVRKQLSDYNTLNALEKPKFQNTLPDIAEIQQARKELDALRKSVRNFVTRATAELETERAADIASGKKGKNISEIAVFSRAIELHKSAKGKTRFTIYEKNKLVNMRRAHDANRPTGGYISGRNHRKDFYLDANGVVCWQCVSMLEANDRNFTPRSELSGNELLWSAHKEDTLEMDDPNDSSRRIRVVVAKFDGQKMGVVPDTEARDSRQRVMWEYGLRFFREKRAQRIVTDALGEITWRFPPLSRSGKKAPSP